MFSLSSIVCVSLCARNTEHRKNLAGEQEEEEGEEEEERRAARFQQTAAASLCSLSRRREKICAGCSFPASWPSCAGLRLATARLMREPSALVFRLELARFARFQL